MSPALLQAKPTLASLMDAWRKEKSIEITANKARLAIEEQIAAILPAKHPEERRTIEVNGFRFTVAYKVTRKVDADALRAAWATIPARAAQCFRWKAEVDAKEMRKIAELCPTEYGIAAQYIETKPAKPSVTVEPIEGPAK